MDREPSDREDHMEVGRGRDRFGGYDRIAQLQDFGFDLNTSDKEVLLNDSDRKFGFPNVTRYLRFLQLFSEQQGCMVALKPGGGRIPAWVRHEHQA